MNTYKSTKRITILIAIAFWGIVGNLYSQTLVITEAFNLENPKEKYYFIDCENIALKNNLLQKYEGNTKYLTVRSTDESTPAILHNKKVLTRDDAAQFCLTGAGGCIIGTLINMSTTTVNYDGTMEQNTGVGVVATAFQGSGCVLGTIGVVALFKPKAKPVKEAAVQQTTDEIIKSTNLFKGNVSSWNIKDESDINNKVIPFLLTKNI